jgi:hypothetical protein
MWLAVGAVGMLLWRDSRYQSAYNDIARGMPKSLVLKKFGRPQEARPCVLKSWDGEPLNGTTSQCIDEIWYYSQLSPEQWVIGFDKDGRAVAKYHMVSP